MITASATPSWGVSPTPSYAVRRMRGICRVPDHAVLD